MKKIGLTGNIASGKTTVENIIKAYNYKVIDADKICHDLLENDFDIIDKIKSLFKNEDIFDENYKLSRKKIGKIVFNSENLRKDLENILHPAIFEKINSFFDENSGNKTVFASVPLLFETNSEKLFDKIIFVSSDEKIRLKRLMQRNNLSKNVAVKRINSQLPEEIKIAKSDYVIYNNGSIDELEVSVKNLLKILCSDRV